MSTRVAGAFAAMDISDGEIPHRRPSYTPAPPAAPSAAAAPSAVAATSAAHDTQAPPRSPDTKMAMPLSAESPGFAGSSLASSPIAASFPHSPKPHDQHAAVMSQASLLVRAASTELAHAELYAGAEFDGNVLTFRGFEGLCTLANKGEQGTTRALIYAGALKVYLRGLTSSDAGVQRGALKALLSITISEGPSLAAPSAAPNSRRPSSTPGSTEPQPTDISAILDSVLESVLETVLGMAFLPGSSRALQLLNTLAAQAACAHRLCHPQKYDSVLALVRIQADHADYYATSQVRDCP